MTRHAKWNKCRYSSHEPTTPRLGGIDYADDWIQLGYTADEAREWDMDPVFADAWAQVGAQWFEAHAYYDAGLEPEDAEWWIAQEYDSNEVADAHLAVRGDPHLQRWVEAGHTLAEAVRFIRAGVSLEEARRFPAGDVLDVLGGLRNSADPDDAALAAVAV